MYIQHATPKRVFLVTALLGLVSSFAHATGTASAYETAMETPVTTIQGDLITFLPVVLTVAVILWGVGLLKSLFKKSSK